MRFGAEMRARIEAVLRDDDPEGLRALLDSGLSPLANDTTLATPVSLAAQAGAHTCVHLLLKEGGSPDAGDPPPLVGAILGGHYEVLDLLLASGADPGSQPYDEDEEPPLVVAAERGDARAIRALAAAGAVAVSAPGYLGAAAQRVALEVIMLFPRIQVGTAQLVTRALDYSLRLANRFALLEVKYAIPRGAEAFNRLVAQLTEGVTMLPSLAGPATQQQVVLWTYRAPQSLAQIQRLYNALGPTIAPRVQFVHGVPGLANWLRFYFGV